MNEYYIMLNGQQSGPYTIEQIRSMWYSGAVHPTTSYCQRGMQSWQALATIQHLLVAPSNQAVQYVTVHHQMIVRPAKSRAAYILLGLFLGGLGIHNFYAGYTGKGIAQLLIMLFTGWLVIPIFIVGLWVLIEIIAVNTDANGIRMT